MHRPPIRLKKRRQPLRNVAAVAENYHGFAHLIFAQQRPVIALCAVFLRTPNSAPTFSYDIPVSSLILRIANTSSPVSLASLEFWTCSWRVAQRQLLGS